MGIVNQPTAVKALTRGITAIMVGYTQHCLGDINDFLVESGRLLGRRRVLIVGNRSTTAPQQADKNKHKDRISDGITVWAFHGCIFLRISLQFRPNFRNRKILLLIK